VLKGPALVPVRNQRKPVRQLDRPLIVVVREPIIGQKPKDVPTAQADAQRQGCWIKYDLSETCPLKLLKCSQDAIISIFPAVESFGPRALKYSVRIGKINDPLAREFVHCFEWQVRALHQRPEVEVPSSAITSSPRDARLTWKAGNQVSEQDRIGGYKLTVEGFRLIGVHG
jgi:hypothetical protein